jgi:hypothetical protein
MIESVSHDPLFEFDLEQVDVAFWLDVGQPGTRAVRQRWRAISGQRASRRGATLPTSPTGARAPT